MTLTRRQMFATTGGVVAGASLFPLAKIVDAQRPARTEDKVALHVGQEFARFVKLARQGRLRSEHLQSVASNLRLWAVTFDNDQLKSAAVKYRAAGNLQPNDHSQHGKRAAEVKKLLGIDVTAEMALFPVVQPSEATAALNTVAREGLVPTLLKIADGLEAKAAQMALRERDGTTPFALVQDYTGPYCAYFPTLQISVDIICAAVFWLGPQGAVACAVAVTYQTVWYFSCR